jgi:transposase
MKERFYIRKKAVLEYLKGDEINLIAERYGVHIKTLRRWIKRYKLEGEDGLKRKKTVKRSPNRFPIQIEKKIAIIKESNPRISLRDAKEILEKDGMKISIKGIWSIWKRYGLTGYTKEKMFMDIRTPVVPSIEISVKLREIDNLLESGNVKKALSLVNELPYFPLFEKIDERKFSYSLLHKFSFQELSPLRKLDWLYPLFGQIPYTEYRDIARKLRKELKRKGFNYSALIAGVLEVIALGWTGEVRRQLSLIKELKNELGSMKAPHIRYILYHSEGLVYSKQLEIQKASISVRKLKQLLPHLPCEYAEHLVPLLSSLSRLNEARELAEKCLNVCKKGERRDILQIYLSHIYAANGEYLKALRILKNLKISLPGLHSRILLTKSRISLCQGNIKRVMKFALSALEEAKKEDIKNHFHNASFLLASAYRALGYTSKASDFLKSALPSVKSMGNLKDLYLWNIILGKGDPPKHAFKHPVIKLGILLKRASETLNLSRYREAFRLAERHKFLGIFYQLCLFFPQPVKKCLEKRIDPLLPNAFLKLPVFMEEPPVYHVNLLGPLKVFKNGKPLKGRLTPKQSSLLLFLVLYPQNKIPVDKLYKNYWKNCKNPSRNLTRMLTSIRKFLEIHRSYIRRVKFHIVIDVHFTSDYQHFLEHIAKAKVFDMMGDNYLAKLECEKALSLVKGKPFEKMYDNFAEDTRTQILSLINMLKEKVKLNT